jgi:S-adenosylmethionine:tRNA ribosyltransferase-isomerase
MLFNDPRSIQMKDYDYDLPTSKIAAFPSADRDGAQLLLYKNGSIRSSIYSHLTDYLPPSSLLIFNDTKVISARLLFQKPSGTIIEVFCLSPDHQYGSIEVGLQQVGNVRWKCLVGGANKWKTEQVLHQTIVRPANEPPIVLEARCVEKLEDGFVVAFSWQPHNLSFASVLQAVGTTPLPPYIKRKVQEVDKERYQTVYALHLGSVAAPTAGLHFTPSLFEKLRQKNIQHQFITLHVGAGTFKPVTASHLLNHHMHEEFIQVSTSLIEALLKHAPLVYPVGTTALRTVESLYWMGVKIFLKPLVTPAQLMITQWEVYDHLMAHAIPVEQSLTTLLGWMKKSKIDPLLTTTQLLVAPGYPRSKLIKGLITNFHQPQSTLLLLIAALIGPEWKKIYQYALDNNFRFLSYGDGCLLEVSEAENNYLENTIHYNV